MDGVAAPPNLHAMLPWLLHTTIEISASELRIELMFPADDASAAYFRDRAASRGAG